MDLRRADDNKSRFAAYVEGLVSVTGTRTGQAATGLLRGADVAVRAQERGAYGGGDGAFAGGSPASIAAAFVGEGQWSDEKVLAKVREMVLPEMERHGSIEAWIIDDTGFPKQGLHSVGVARQYCGQLGKQDNCQVAVSLSIANHHASLPVAYRLYLPQDWAKDRQRRRKAGVPEDIGFKTKPEIAIEQLRWACAAGLPRGVVLMDAGYGMQHRFARWRQRARAELCRRHLAADVCMGIGHGAAAAGKVVGPRATAKAHPPGRQASTDLSQATRPRPAKARLAHGQVAGGCRPSTCPRALRACAFVWRIAITISPKAGRKSGC